MTTKEVEQRRDTALSNEPSRMTGVAGVPDVDIRENGTELRLAVNLPGVDLGGAQVTVENGVLRIEAESTWEPPAGYELVSREFEPTRYRREFALSDRLRVEGIRARMTNGVLDLTIPKAEEVRARKIEIAA